MNENAAAKAIAAMKSGWTGKIPAPTIFLVGGILAMAGGWSGYAVTRSLAGIDSLRQQELDRRILSEARQLADSASSRLALAAAWAQAAQLLSADSASASNASVPPSSNDSSLRPPVAQWHLHSTVVREQASAGTGLLTLLGQADWVASRLKDGSLQLVSRLRTSASARTAESPGASDETALLVSRWREGLLDEAFASFSARSASGKIRARLWFGPEESLGKGSTAVDRLLLKSAFAGEKLRGFGALSGTDDAAARRLAFDRSSGGGVVATVDAEAIPPAVAWGGVTASASPYFAVLAFFGAILSGLGAVFTMLRSPAKKRRKEIRIEESPAPGPVLAEISLPRSADGPKTMGLGAESAGAPVFVAGPAPTPASASSSTAVIHSMPDASGSGDDSEEVRELRLRVSALEREIESARRVIRVMQDEDRTVFEFERDAIWGRDPRTLGDRLAKAASKLCGSPALYFQFQAPLEALSLVAESGIESALVPSQLHVSIDGPAIERISQLAQEGSIPSLAGYEPLAQAVLRQFGASHFDAWAVTGYSWLGRAAGKPRLLGVLVLLQPGSETLTRVRSLGRMVRNVGLLFENTLLSQH